MKSLFIAFTLLLSMQTAVSFAQEKQEDKLAAAAEVLQSFTNSEEEIPVELLKITEGIIVVPKLVNAGFVLAGKRGKGIAMVKKEDGSWSNPVFVTITGGSVGFQAGVQSVDLVLVFRNAETLEKIGNGSFTLGGDISVTVGPVGRNSTASTDYKMEAEVYSYSKSKGLFAGISISGSAISVDQKANNSFYSNDDDASAIFASPDSNYPAVIRLKTLLASMAGAEE